jgi:ABC-type oligopeptide transport system substrate-binding subunit
MNYEFAGMGWFGDYNDPSSFLETFMSNQSTISTGWKNDEYDKLLKKATITLDNENRYQYFKRAEEILIKDSVIAPTVYIKSRIFYKKEIQGLMAPAFGCTNYKNVFIEK